VKRLTSLLLVEERLLEAEHFALLLKGKRSPEIQFYLNAFLSAARSVTFLIQKELRHTEGFDTYWQNVQNELRSDDCARFFLELRNFSQKAGRVNLVGCGGVSIPKIYVFPESLGEAPFMLYFFADGQVTVPSEAKLDDVVVACLKHTAKLAKLVIRTLDRFPYDTCPCRACSQEGARHLGVELADFLEIAGYPRNWITASTTIPLEEAYRLASSVFDAVDREAIAAIMQYEHLKTS
jgi:hypothetical protein